MNHMVLEDLQKLVFFFFKEMNQVRTLEIPVGHSCKSIPVESDRLRYDTIKYHTLSAYKHADTSSTLIPGFCC